MAAKRYENLDQVPNLNSFRDLLAWRKERRGKRKDFSFAVGQAGEKVVDKLAANRSAATVTWIGHSTFLIQFGGLNIVTDPVWAGSMAFEKRLTQPGLTLEQLPPIDVVLLSHSHYDHLDMPSWRRLARKGSFRAFVPAGLGQTMQRKGFRDTEELAWWESAEVQGVEFHFVPAQHWTRRSLTDTNASHWGGWVIKRAESAGAEGDRSGAIYFAGDSGYFRGFKLIGEKFRIHTALMPIGAYEPEWFMTKQHVTPEEAVQAYVDVQAELFVPMHYGAFRLADDTPKEALDRLHAEWTKRSLPEDRLKTLLLGETLLL